MSIKTNNDGVYTESLFKYTWTQVFFLYSNSFLGINSLIAGNYVYIEENPRN